MRKPKVTKYGSNAVLLTWDKTISDEIHDNVLFYEQYISTHFLDLVVETVPTYQSLLIDLKQQTDRQTFIEKIGEIRTTSDFLSERKRTKYFIPVCYDQRLGIDLDILAKERGLEIDMVSQIHQKVPYKIYSMGFLPGFLYLGHLDEQLHTPRRKIPRVKVPKGAVAIGGQQTGIYPQESPGGWHIIGQTPVDLFDVGSDPPSVFLPGDMIQFYAIDYGVYHEIKKQMESGRHELRKEVIND